MRDRSRKPKTNKLKLSKPLQTSVDTQSVNDVIFPQNQAIVEPYIAAVAQPVIVPYDNEEVFVKQDLGHLFVGRIGKIDFIKFGLVYFDWFGDNTPISYIDVQPNLLISTITPDQFDAELTAQFNGRHVNKVFQIHLPTGILFAVNIIRDNMLLMQDGLPKWFLVQTHHMDHDTIDWLRDNYDMSYVQFVCPGGRYSYHAVPFDYESYEFLINFAARDFKRNMDHMVKYSCELREQCALREYPNYLNSQIAKLVLEAYNDAQNGLVDLPSEPQYGNALISNSTITTTSGTTSYNFADAIRQAAEQNPVAFAHDRNAVIAEAALSVANHEAQQSLHEQEATKLQKLSTLYYDMPRREPNEEDPPDNDSDEEAGF